MPLSPSPADAGAADAELVPIDALARRFGLRASAIRYYEERGLLEPTSRHSGRRWYGPTEVRRLAVIQYWQETGLMSLEQIGEILAGPSASRRWREVLEERVEALASQIERMQEAKVVLQHILVEHSGQPDDSLDGCPYYESFIWDRRRAHDHPGHGLPAHGLPAHEHQEHENRQHEHPGSGPAHRSP
jgi:DNA-binding transcriptional MerR regulator